MEMTTSVSLLLTIGLAASPQELRDLKMYDKAGPYVFEFRRGEVNPKIAAAMREFLWSHWIRHQRGYASSTQSSIEGEASTAWYYVEPDEKGVWRISVRIERRSETVEYDAYIVERIEPPKNRLTEFKRIDDKDNRPAQSYRLVLRDKTGNLQDDL